MKHRSIQGWLACAVVAAAFAPGAASAAGMAQGRYECWANGRANMMLNFTVRSGTQYLDAENKKGTYRLDAGSGQVEFKGGGLDGAMPKGYTAVYHAPKGKPTLSFRSARGAEAAFCEHVK